jgi:hypothetical protein
MADVKQFNIDGTVYDVKDATARENMVSTAANQSLTTTKMKNARDNIGAAFTTYLAPEFDETKNYSVGELTNHNNTLYRCTTSHTGAWNASHFESVNVGDEIGAIWEANGILGAKNLINWKKCDTTSNCSLEYDETIGSYTLTSNGSSSGNVQAVVKLSYADIKNYIGKKVTLSISSWSQTNSSLIPYVVIYKYPGEVYVNGLGAGGAGITQNSCTFIMPECTYMNLVIRMNYGGASTQSGNKLVINGIMLRLDTDADATYQPYAMTNLQLTRGAGRKLPLIDLGTEYTSELKNDISSGRFEKAVVGGYLTITYNDTPYKFYFAHPDYFYGTGDTGKKCTTHHMVVIPADNLASGKMNSAHVTTGGYVGSDFRTGNNSNTTLATIKSIIEGCFGANNILLHREYLINAITDNYASAGAWYDSDVELMNECMVYGSYIYGNKMNGTVMSKNATICKSQLELFSKRPDLIPLGNTYYLRDICDSSRFCSVATTGLADYSGATGSFYSRPYFAIC